jgi:hypothetical protein
LDGDHYKSTTFSTITTRFIAITIVDTRRFTSYWIVDGGSGTTTFFCNVQTMRNTCIS